MSISFVDAGDIRKITISGRLDVDGTNSVATQLEEPCATTLTKSQNC